MKSSMLGNLSAIVSDTLTDSIKMIDIAELHESADNFFVLENIEPFAQIILGQGGVKDNLIVRPLETGGYEIISGHRRRAAVQWLIDNGENISHFLPCLVQNYTDEDDKILDLILMNVSARQLSDSELWKSYETIDKILKEKKAKGEYFGRIRDDIAKHLGVSSAQVGKMQNIEKNAIAAVKEAIASGDLSISTANEIAKLDNAEQSNIRDLSKVQPKDIKKNTAVDTNINDNKNSSNVKWDGETHSNEILEALLYYIDEDDIQIAMKKSYGDFGEDLRKNHLNDGSGCDLYHIDGRYNKILVTLYKFDITYEITWNKAAKLIHKHFHEKVDTSINNPIVFHDEQHETSYNDICSRMKYLDCYHRSLAYLLSLDTVLREHIDAVYDIHEDVIKPEGLNNGFQTGTSLKTTRIAFNLWNGYCSDGDDEEQPSSNYAPDQIFNCKEYALYYWIAIQIRFGI